MRIRDQPAGLGDRDAQFLGGQRILVRIPAGQQEKLQHDFRQPVDHQYQRQHDPRQRAVDVGCRESDLFRVGRGEGFRSDFGQ